MHTTSTIRLEPADAVRYLLVSDDRDIETAVRSDLPPPYEIIRFPLEGVVDEHLRLSWQGRNIVEAARTASAVLIAWRFDRAPVINTLCYHIRRELLAPVVAVCRGGEEDVVAAVAAGADDAFTLPIHPPHLHARTFAYRRLTEAAKQAQFASAPPAPGAAGHHDVLTFGVLKLDRTAHRFFVREEEVELTPREFSLLACFIENPNTLLTRDQILDGVWGITFDTGTNMVDVYMYFVRRKLEARGIKGMIETVRGRGYRLVIPDPAVS